MSQQTSKLTNAQLQEFLDELAEVEQLPEEEKAKIKANKAWGFIPINDEEAQKDYLKIVNGVEAGRAAAQRNVEKAAKYKERDKNIRTEAINDDFIDLNTPLSIKHKRILIALQTANYKTSVDKTRVVLVNHVWAALRMCMPERVKRAEKLNPKSIVQAPPFTWHTKDGQDYRIEFIRPIIYYFEPENCQSIIEKSFPERAETIEKDIHYFYKNSKMLVQRETSMAETLAPMRTFYELLKKKPTWYKALIEELKQREQNGNEEKSI